jgi:PAB1-binding protein PBP1
MSNYGPKGAGLYDPVKNLERKRTRTGEEIEGVGRNKGVRQYTTSLSGTAKEQAESQAKADKEKNKKQPVKIVTADQMPADLKAQLEARANAKKSDEEYIEFNKCGQWDLKKRCWEGYKPVKGKKPYSEDSCEPIKKSDEVELFFYDDGTIDAEFYEDQEDLLVKTMAEIGFDILEKKEWSPKAKHKSKSGGLTKEGVESYRRANPGSKLQTAVTEDKPSGKRAKRRKSFCARNKGQIQMHNIDCQKTPEKRACLARKKWKCTN